MDLSAAFVRGQQTCLADPSWDYEISFTNFLHPKFYGNHYLETDQEFLDFCIEFEPFTLVTALHATSTMSWYHFSASPLAVQLSGFYLDYFWSPNVRTLILNGLPV